MFSSFSGGNAQHYRADVSLSGTCQLLKFSASESPFALATFGLSIIASISGESLIAL